MLIGLQNVTFEFGSRIIVEDATWHIQPGDRVGLIGYNGTGKSTLLKVLVGEYTPTKGVVEKGKDTTIGYLHQDLLSFDTNDSILEVAMGAFEKVKQLEKEIEAIAKQLETTETEALLMEYTHKLHELEEAGGYTIHHKTEEVLQGLGFQNSDLQKPYKQFSGGWRMRVLLAKMILQQPDVLLLDEPTNHLDLPSIEWLEKYLKHYQGSVVIVSHDKYFLNKMVNKIVELYQQQLHIYAGNFDYYEKEKELRIELQQKAYENQQDYIRQQERFIERFRSKATKAAAAQSAIKRLEKIDRLENVNIERPNIKINFQIEKQPGKIICELKNIHKSFGDITLLNNAHAEIERGDKIALIGANGKGKSTLLRIIAGTETQEGNRIWGHNVQESFYAQHQLEALNLNNTILEEMQSCGSNKTDLELRSLLGCFLFGGDDIDKKIRLLSGGEKARVALAKVIVSRSNFLILDEPTNHLDMHSVELLAEALNKYEGSYLLVSHDRFFIDKTANKIWEIVDQQIKEFKGTYREWLDWNERMAKQQNSAKNSAQEPIKSTPPKNTDTEQKKQNTGNAQKKEYAQVQKKFQQTEALLEHLNEQKLELEMSLAHPNIYKEPQKMAELEKAYQTVVQKWNEAQANYESLFEKLMELEG
ncbi:ribosomal protection-like ABC-F family protein [Hydrotalea sandarakina]|jgi:ATP-binding cassette subfamily F protein 3|uniref:ATP-binding cassette subfamily F protein 3 n=1 Tax=Hydrotalea sandarakina TaxID=1004304 RepID=A0A2W7S085_9BACT|nr:ABC-F family ATP-binding cassette domain-containing protein [Hydrotalea sandarakina]PZX65924.1 ATP-binding cassette subfamily F protein 3 [Hydrotalea sandarakina]